MQFDYNINESQKYNLCARITLDGLHQIVLKVFSFFKFIIGMTFGDFLAEKLTGILSV